MTRPVADGRSTMTCEHVAHPESWPGDCGDLAGVAWSLLSPAAQVRLANMVLDAFFGMLGWPSAFGAVDGTPSPSLVVDDE